MVQKIIITVILLVSIAGFSSCKSVKKENPQNANGIEGVFIGNLPCGDCAAVRTMVKLSAPDNIEVNRLYVGKSDSLFSITGKFNFNKENNRITFKEKGQLNQYIWAENKITQLDPNGNRITGKFADKYILTRDTLNLFRYWKLMTLNGNSIKNNQQNDLHIQFRTKQNQVSGFAGCNRFNGTFSVYGNVLKISQLGSTKMACPNPNPEADFLKALNEVYYYRIQNETLQLSSQENNVLLEFSVNYLK